MENIIAKHKASTITADEILSYNKSLCQSIRVRLFCIFKVYTMVAAIAKKPFESRKIIRCRNNP